MRVTWAVLVRGSTDRLIMGWDLTENILIYLGANFRGEGGE